jgi:hypothetical protein
MQSYLYCIDDQTEPLWLWWLWWWFIIIIIIIIIIGTKKKKGSREENCFASEKKECLVEGIACLIDWRLVLDVKQRKNSSKDNLWFKFWYAQKTFESSFVQKNHRDIRVVAMEMDSRFTEIDIIKTYAKRYSFKNFTFLILCYHYI